MALDGAGEALALRAPADLDRVAGLEALDGHDLAGRELERAAELVQVAVRLDAVLAEVPALRLRDLALGHRLEGELDRVIAVIRRAS